MSMEFPEAFDPESEEGNTWKLIPVGEYTAQVIEAGIAPPKSGDGHALTLVWKVLASAFEGRQVWQQICYVHSKEQTQTIARKTLKDICTALDIHEAVQNAEIFLSKPARIRIGIQKDKLGVYQDQNRISRVLPLSSSAGPAAAPVNQPPPPKSDNGGAAAAVPTAPAPRTQGTPRSGPAGTAPWHKQRG